MNDRSLEIRAATAEAIVDAIFYYLKKQTGNEVEVNSLLSDFVRIKEDFERAAKFMRDRDI